MDKTDQIYMNKLNLKKKTHKHPSKKWLGKNENKIESQKVKQTCGSISQLPKILCVGSSPNMTPSSKPIHIHHENRKPRKKNKKKKIQKEKRTQYEKVWILKHYPCKTWNLNRSKRGRRRRRRISEQMI